MSERIQYETERGYPDLLDLRMFLSNSKLLDRSLAPELFQDFRVSHDWLVFIRSACHWHGKHIGYTARELYTIAQDFLGYKLREDAFRIAIYDQWPKAKSLGLDDVIVKAPDLTRVKELIPEWDAKIARVYGNKEAA